eukprot:15470086-Alexandrium_andersonii.AAC.1
MPSGRQRATAARVPAASAPWRSSVRDHHTQRSSPADSTAWSSFSASAAVKRRPGLRARPRPPLAAHARA